MRGGGLKRPYPFSKVDMLNQDEVAYWDHVAHQCIDDSNKLFKENIVKKRTILAKLLGFDFQGASILEIGIGAGTIADALNAIYCRQISYNATDLSAVFCKFCANRKIPTMQASVTDLPYPDKSFDWVFAFDSLEHVKPDEREHGYQEIDRVMKNDACIILNIPEDTLTSGHDKRFDHGYSYIDFVELLKATKSMLAQYNVYTIKYPTVGYRTYAFAVGERHIA